jgi:hypothetical protein
MAGIADILGRLAAPVADDVARAAAEFGDDAVRSILKATPAMRKRLADLAEKRVKSSATSRMKKETFTNPKTGRASRAITSNQDDIDREAMMRIRDYAIGGENPMDYLGPYGKSVNKDIYDFVDMGDGIPDFAARSSMASRFADESGALKRLEQQRAFRMQRGYEPGNDDEYQNAVLSIASGKLPESLSNSIEVGRRLNNLTQTAKSDVADLVLDADVPTLVRQLQMMNALRSMGGIQ